MAINNEFCVVHHKQTNGNAVPSHKTNHRDTSLNERTIAQPQPTKPLISPIKVLEASKLAIVKEMIHTLCNMDGIEAIVLGGSYARGEARRDSDVDLGIYYSEKSPPSINELKKQATRFDMTQNCVVTNFYEWGPWVNGGAWIHTKAGKIDWLYRNIDQVNRVIEDAAFGRFTWDYRQQPPYGFFSVTYLADIQQNIVLYDPKGVCSQWVDAVEKYPESLRQAIIQEHLWSVEFSLLAAKKITSRRCIYGTFGCITRIMSELTQVLFALNRVYFSSEKGAMSTIETFSLRPDRYSEKINAILSGPTNEKELIHTLRKVEELVREVVALASAIYQPKYASL